MNRKFLITFVILLSIIVGLWIWTLAVPKNIINIGGSASVDPLMEKITNRYQKENKQKFVYSSTGSNTGITNLKANVYDVAFISKDVPDDFGAKVTPITKADFQGKDEATFIADMKSKEAGYYSLNFTQDPIVFIYNAQGLNMAPELKNLVRLTLTKDNSLLPTDNGKKLFINKNNPLPPRNWMLKRIYEVERQNDYISWVDLVKDIIAYNSLPQEDYTYLVDQMSQHIRVSPYSSTPGSGTWSSFTKLTGATPGEAVNKYGNNGSNFFQINKSPGAFGYVSMGYAQDLKDYSNLESVIIERPKENLNHSKISTLDSTAMDIWNVKKDGNNSPSGPYPFTRPFNAMVNNNPNNKMMDQIWKFIYWFSTSPKAADIFDDEGLTQAMVEPTNILNENSLIFVLYNHQHELYQTDNWYRGKQWR